MTIARGPGGLVVLALLAVAPSARGQVAPSAAAGTNAADPAPAAAASPAPDPTPPPLSERPPARSLGPSFDSDLLSHLPLGHGLWSVFETVEPTAMAALSPWCAPCRGRNTSG